MECRCSLRYIPTLVVSVENEHLLAVIIAVATKLTLELHTCASLLVLFHLLNCFAFSIAQCRSTFKTVVEILSISVTRVTNSSRESLTSSTSWEEAISDIS